MLNFILKLRHCRGFEHIENGYSYKKGEILGEKIVNQQVINRFFGQIL